MKTIASPCPRVAIVLLATLVADVSACGGQPSGDSGASTDPSTSAAAPDPTPGDGAAEPEDPVEPNDPTEPPARPDDPDADADGRILPPDGPGAEVVWIEDSVYVVVPGSSSCPPKARSIEVVSGTEWIIEVSPRAGDDVACTADLVPHRSRIAAPATADPEADVTAKIVEDGERPRSVPVTVPDISAQ